MAPRLTQRDLRAINAALAQTIAAPEDDDIEIEDYKTAQQKIQDRIHWREDE